MNVIRKTASAKMNPTSELRTSSNANQASVDHKACVLTASASNASHLIGLIGE